MYQNHQLNSSRLVRLLQQWAQGHSAPVRLDIAEQLSQGLSTVDAVKLSRWLHTLESSPPPPPAGGPGRVDVAALEADLRTATAELTEGFTAAPSLRTRPLRERADNTPVPGPDPQAEAEFSVHAARYQASQKQMEMRIGALRAQIRQHLSAGPAHLRRLAALDAVMEQMLGAREQRLWASLPGHLERRMAYRRQCYQQALEAYGQGDGDPRSWRLPGGWLHAFEQDLRALLGAELQVRLQPLAGLVQAARAPGRTAGWPSEPSKIHPPARAGNPALEHQQE